MALRSRVREYRQRAGLSQAALAERVGISRVYVSQIERDAQVPSVDIAHRLAAALNVSILDLFDVIDNGNGAAA